MAILGEEDRVTVWREFMADRSLARDAFGALTKADMRAAVDALDAFLNDNAVTINSAIPQPARAALTTQQKALLLRFVIARRYLSGV